MSVSETARAGIKAHPAGNPRQFRQDGAAQGPMRNDGQVVALGPQAAGQPPGPADSSVGPPFEVDDDLVGRSAAPEDLGGPFHRQDGEAGLGKQGFEPLEQGDGQQAITQEAGLDDENMGGPAERPTRSRDVGRAQGGRRWRHAPNREGLQVTFHGVFFQGGRAQAQGHIEAAGQGGFPVDRGFGHGRQGPQDGGAEVGVQVQKVRKTLLADFGQGLSDAHEGDDLVDAGMAFQGRGQAGLDQEGDFAVRPARFEAPVDRSRQDDVSQGGKTDDEDFGGHSIARGSARRDIISS